MAPKPSLSLTPHVGICVQGYSGSSGNKLGWLGNCLRTYARFHVGFFFFSTPRWRLTSSYMIGRSVQGEVLKRHQKVKFISALKLSKKMVSPRQPGCDVYHSEGNEKVHDYGTMSTMSLKSTC